MNVYSGPWTCYCRKLILLYYLMTIVIVTKIHVFFLSSLSYRIFPALHSHKFIRFSSLYCLRIILRTNIYCSFPRFSLLIHLLVLRFNLVTTTRSTRCCYVDLLSISVHVSLNLLASCVYTDIPTDLFLPGGYIIQVYICLFSISPFTLAYRLLSFTFPMYCKLLR